jgi:hypothetical protein
MKDEFSSGESVWETWAEAVSSHVEVSKSEKFSPEFRR